jgi:hypothetical protein
MKVKGKGESLPATINMSQMNIIKKMLNVGDCDSRRDEDGGRAMEGEEGEYRGLRGIERLSSHQFPVQCSMYKRKYLEI